MRSRLAHALWLATGRADARRFARSLADPEAAARERLHRLVAAHADSRFGRAHHFGRIQTLEDYRERVPLSSADDLAPSVRAIRRGEPGVLTTEPITRLVPTSGSTGPVKWVPYTATLLSEFQRGIRPWLADLHRERPELARGRAYWSISPAPIGSDAPAEFGEDGPSAVPEGFDHDRRYLGFLAARVAGWTMVLPDDPGAPSDAEEHRRWTRFHLLRAEDLTLVSVWHPSFWLGLVEDLAAEWPLLIDAVATGRLPGARNRLAPMPRRARTLRELGPERIAEAWPRLRLISAWGDAAARGPFESLQSRFPGVELQRKGLLATEAFVTLPYRDRHPVAIRSHLFEFIEGDRSRGVHELELDGEYEVVVSTGGGLHRHRLGDRVRVNGFVERTPSLEFLGRGDADRGDAVCDLVGEKLSDAFVTRCLAATVGPVRFAVLGPDLGARRYVLVTETELAADRLSRLDTALAGNPHYRYARALGQLEPPEHRRVTDAETRYLQAQLARGRRLGDIKPPALVPDLHWLTDSAPRTRSSDASARSTQSAR